MSTAEDEELRTLREWKASVLELARGVSFQNFLRSYSNQQFQMAGRYDGAMSEECKELCRKDHRTAEMLLSELR